MNLVSLPVATGVLTDVTTLTLILGQNAMSYTFILDVKQNFRWTMGGADANNQTRLLLTC